MKRIKVGLWGATGYTGREILRCLLRHPQVDVEVLVAKVEGEVPVAEEFPELASLTDAVCLPDASFDGLDVVFLALPHTVSMRYVPRMLDAGVRVIDLSADYRLKDVDAYAAWYGERHVDAQHLDDAVYGLPEWYREDVRRAALVANPGCFPTAALLGILPFLEVGLKPSHIMVDAKTGISGGGRNPKMVFHFPECNESVLPYKVGSHQHEPEIRSILGRVGGFPVELLFVPHLVPMTRGICCTSYLVFHETLDVDPLGVLRDRYADEPFVRVKDVPPATRHVVGSNYCDVFATVRENVVVIVSAVDNLLKGAAGQAVQNMNIMFEMEETTSLIV